LVRIMIRDRAKVSFYRLGLTEKGPRILTDKGLRPHALSLCIHFVHVSR